MNCTPAIITLALLIAADPAHSEDSAKPISGTYALGGATLIDPPANEAKNTHLRLYLTGNAARELYAALPTPAVHDECLDDGSMTKAVGGTSCTRMEDADVYECSHRYQATAHRAASAC